ncbi:glycoside hydrolase family 16 protein [Phenylobacterium deserti]|uniref:Glycoside hydrolase family 16 protein n=2 Tax=Phenylobacterium deserti TaxID=1914756 RepID=A0A328AUC6_9CAUL|nr:glycoside hydrolase family 16 protein [Phenylobacterium deserti]
MAALLAFAAATSAASGAAARERTVFFDDFSGAKLDRFKWNVVVPDWVVNNEQQAYVDDPRVVAIVHGAEAEGAENGALRIRAVPQAGHKTRAGRTFDFLSGRLDTRGKFAFSHGTAAARIKMTAGQGLWPAFWILGEGQWPAIGEIDVMENVGEADWTSFALHGPGYSGDTPLAQRAPFPAGQDITGWHIYSVDWSDEALVFRVDGAERYRVTRAMVEKHGRWAFDDAKYLIVNLALGGGYPQGVNKVEAPYPGLPQSTVDLIGAGKGQVLVDWVKVTKSEP